MIIQTQNIAKIIDSESLAHIVVPSSLTARAVKPESEPKRFWMAGAGAQKF